MDDHVRRKSGLVQTSPVFFAKAFAIFIKNRTIRQNIHRQNIIFNRHRIIKITLAIKKLLQFFHHVIGDFTLRCFNGSINDWHLIIVVPCRCPTFANRINENAKS